MTYPITFEVPWVERHSRLTTFFRLLLAIPWMLVGFFYFLVAYITVVIAWFVLVFTASYPPGLYRFHSGVLRFGSRINAWFYLLTDAWPPFGLDEAPGYPVRVGVPPPQQRYSRARAGFRLIVGIPTLVMLYVFAQFLSILGFCAWFVIVFTGRLPQGLHDALVLTMRYSTRAYGYFLLITETQPPISDRSAQPVGAIEAGRPEAVGPAVAAQAPAVRRDDPFPEGPEKLT